MIVEKENGEKEVLVDFQSYQMGYRAAAKDFSDDPREKSVRIIAFVLVASFAYIFLTLMMREN